MISVISQTNFPTLKLRRRGKVRDLYECGDRLLIVATDRLSAFDVVLPTPIPDKGRVLTQLSALWFRELESVVANHLISVTDFADELTPYSEILQGRAMLVRPTEPLRVECVVRGYLAGSGWKEYQQTGTICGIQLPKGLRESERLPEPIFTPATKTTNGHDENITFEEAANRIGCPHAEQVRRLSLEIYSRAADYAAARGILIADTKLEFGLAGDEVIWIDEAITPDSSRFWPADKYAPGRAQPSFDKQFVRDYVERVGWNKRPPAPELPPDVVAATREKYREAYRRLTGYSLD